MRGAASGGVIPRAFAWASAVGLLFGLLGCAAEPAPEHSASIGVLLDYTGTEASGFNEERAFLLASHLMADAREDGLPFRVMYRDTRDNEEDARSAALELVAEGVDVVLGPSTDRLAPIVGEVLEDTDVVLVSPNPTIGDIGTAAQPWFRMSPGNLTGSTTPALIGEHMARECMNRGEWRVLIATDDDVYDVELANGFKRALTSRGGETVTELSAERAQSQKVVDALNRADADTVVLAMGIVPAARLIADVYASTRVVPYWMLTPRLKSDALLLNTPQGALDGAFGVSLRISSRVSGCAEASADDCFGNAMQSAWGEAAFENTHFMYDAAAVVLIGIDKVLRENAGSVDRSHLNRAIFSTAERGGVLIDWNDFPLAVERARSGGSVQYSGVTGPIVFTESGSRVGGNTIVFEVENHAFVDLDK